MCGLRGGSSLRACGNDVQDGRRLVRDGGRGLRRDRRRLRSNDVRGRDLLRRRMFRVQRPHERNGVVLGDGVHVRLQRRLYVVRWLLCGRDE
jgi:hypothetical protein